MHRNRSAIENQGNLCSIYLEGLAFVQKHDIGGFYNLTSLFEPSI